MDHLWTPWRFQYMSTSDRVSECVFCRILNAERTGDRQNFVLRRSRHSYIVLNRYPYTSGHLMVVTRRHIPSLSTADSAELEEMVRECRRCERVLQQVYQPDGFNIGINIGKSAGAGVAGHLHVHVVPRWQGDANFVSVVGETRVIPEDLQVTFEKLQSHFLTP